MTMQGPRLQTAGACYDSEDTTGPDSELALPSDSHKHTTWRCTRGKQFSSNTQRKKKQTFRENCFSAMPNSYAKHMLWQRLFCVRADNQRILKRIQRESLLPNTDANSVPNELFRVGHLILATVQSQLCMLMHTCAHTHAQKRKKNRHINASIPSHQVLDYSSFNQEHRTKTRGHAKPVSTLRNVMLSVVCLILYIHESAQFDCSDVFIVYIYYLIYIYVYISHVYRKIYMTKGALLANKVPPQTEELCQRETKGKGKTMKANVILHLFQGYAFCSSTWVVGCSLRAAFLLCLFMMEICQETSPWLFLGCALNQ